MVSDFLYAIVCAFLLWTVRPGRLLNTPSVSVTVSNKSLNVVSIYRPPASKCAEFLEDFLSLVGILSSLPSPFIISGDFNLHLNENNTYGDKFMSLLDSCFLKQHTSCPTHLHGRILDLLITSDDFAGVSDLTSLGAVSDHFAIACNIDIDNPLTFSKKIIKFRQFHKIDMNRLLWRSPKAPVLFPHQPKMPVVYTLSILQT